MSGTNEILMDIKNLKNDLDQKMSAINSAKLELEEIKKNIAIDQDEFDKLGVAYDKKNKELKALDGQIAEKEIVLSGVNISISGASDELSIIKKDIDTAKTQIKELDNIIKQRREESILVESQLATEHAETVMKNLSDLNKIKNEIANAKLRKADIDTEVNNSNIALSEIDIKIKSAKLELEKIELAKTELSNTNTGLKNEIAINEKKLTKSLKESESLENVIKENIAVMEKSIVDRADAEKQLADILAQSNNLLSREQVVKQKEAHVKQVCEKLNIKF